MHLTNELQSELAMIGSAIRLRQPEDTEIRFNYKDWAWGDSGTRSIQACQFVGKEGVILQLIERGIIAGSSSVLDIPDIALIIENWLGKQYDLFEQAKEYDGIMISEKYLALRTMSNRDILDFRWASLLDRIEKGSVSFRKDVFEAFRETFSDLFPFFSLDNLYFSNILESSNADFRSPFIYCGKGFIEVGPSRHQTENNENVRTNSIAEAVMLTKKLMPPNFGEAFNPLTTP